MKRENFISKAPAFSIAYAIIALVVTAIAIIGLTPVLTRKLPNLSTSSMIKNPKGWYESYNAPGEGANVCIGCMEAEEAKKCEECRANNDAMLDSPQCKEWKEKVDKNHSFHCPNAPSNPTLTVPVTIQGTGGRPSCYGNPACNPFVTNPEKIVPFEQYCKSNGKCGMPADKCEQGDNTCRPDKPHPCRNKKCKFKPTEGVAKFEVYAIGGGGASGSAVKKDINSVDGGKGRATSPLPDGATLPPATPLTSDEIIGTTSTTGIFIDENNLLDSNMAKGDFYTAKPELPKPHTNGVEDIFNIYPTDAYDNKFSKISSRQVKRILKDAGIINTTYKVGSHTPQLSQRYYLYTRLPGAYAYNQNPEYTLMPEWLKVDGKEPKFPCDVNFAKSNNHKCCKDPNGKYHQIVGSSSSDICDTYSSICTKNCNEPSCTARDNILCIYPNTGSVGCSGDGGKGGDASYGFTGPCGWMTKPSGCPAKFIPGLVKTGRTIGPQSTCQTGGYPTCYETQFSADDGTGKGDKGKWYCSYYNAYKSTCDCSAGASNQWWDCTCNNKEYPGSCIDTSKERADCLPSTANHKIDPSDPSSWDAAVAAAQEAQADGSTLPVTVVDSNGNVVATDLYVNPYNDTPTAQIVGDSAAARNNEGQTAYFATRSGTCKIAGCNRNGNQHHTYATGGAGGHGICGFISCPVKDKNIKDVTPEDTSNIDAGYVGSNPGSGGAGSHSASDGNPGINANPTINKGNTVCSATVVGGRGGHKGFIPNTCDKSGYHGVAAQGAQGTVGSPSCSDCISHEVNSTYADTTGTAESGIGVKPGIYNYHYIWYMPFVTKHLMFGAAGQGGEEIHTMVTLSKGESLSVNPGKGARKTEYKSGENGKPGEESTVTSIVIDENGRDTESNKIKITAPGGKGGLGSQKTDEYVLCHYADIQSKDKNLPCYYKNDKDNSYKTTHKYENGKFVGIQATQPKVSLLVNSMKMSDNLRTGKPGMGGMGYGTASVSDFICNKRHVDKKDKINGENIVTKRNVLTGGGSIEDPCRGNSRLKYLDTNGAEYTAGTGAVVIVW